MSRPRIVHFSFAADNNNYIIIALRRLQGRAISITVEHKFCRRCALFWRGRVVTVIYQRRRQSDT